MAIQFVFFAILAFSTQGFAKVYEEPTAIQPRDINEELQKLVEKLIQEVSAAAKEVVDRLRELYEQLAEETKEKVQAALEDLKKIFESTLAELRKIVEEAKEVAAEAEKCVEAELPALQELQQNTQAALNKCREDALAKVQQTVQIVVTAVQGSINKVQGLVKEWESCTNILCKAGVIAKVSGVIQDLRESGIKAWEDVKAVVRDALPQTVNCLKSAAEENAKESAVIIGRVRECVNQIGN